MRGCVLVWAVLLWLMAAGTAVAGAPLSSDAIGGSIIRPPSGLYVLDRAIGFNVLDAAAIDPKSGRIMLVGHREKRYGDAQIPYLELLACLLKNPTPHFSLPPTPESMRRADDFLAGNPGLKILKILLDVYASGIPSPEAKALLDLPASASDGEVIARLNQLGSTRGTDIRSALMAAIRGSNGLLLDGEGIGSALALSGPIAESLPTYRGIDPSSQLAHTMFEADYLSKGLDHDPTLAEAIPGYETESAFERSHASTGHGNLEQVSISIGHLDLARSFDGMTLETRGVRMLFNVREQTGSLSSVTTRLGRPTPYEALMTALYDPLSQRYPLLHELSEAAKLAAVARWINVNPRRMGLPSYGLTKWKESKTVPARIYTDVYQSSGSLAVHETTVVVGGNSLDPFPGTSGLPEIHADPVVLDLNKTTLAVPPMVGLRPGSKAVAWVRNVPGEMPYQVAVAGVSDISGDLASGTGTNGGLFGESQPVPNLAPANYPPVGSDTSALDQVRSATASGGAARAAAIDVDASGNAKLAFDTSGGPGAPMPASPPTQLGSPSEKIPAAVWNDQLFQKMLGKMKELNQQGAQVRAQIKQQEQVVASAPPNQKSTEEVKLSELYQTKSDIDSQKNYVNFQTREKFNVDVNLTSEPGAGATAPDTGAVGSSAPPPAPPSGRAPPPN